MADKLEKWQQVVMEYIDKWEDLAGEQRFMGDNGYHRNKLLSLKIHMPSGAGHTFLTKYITEYKKTLVIYKDFDHCMEIKDSMCDANEGRVAEMTSYVSVYEVMQGIREASATPHMPSVILQNIKEKIDVSEVVVVDRSSMIMTTILEDWICQHMSGPIVFLG